MYALVRQITDRIFMRRMEGLGGLLAEYSFDVSKGQADERPNIHSVYVGVRGITHRIFIVGMRG
jgi:hypothetical protein